MSHNAFIVAVMALGGCASIGSDSSAVSQDAVSGAVSICKLKAQGLVEGLTVRVEASYKTDKSHYAHLLSAGCGKGGVINVGDLEPVSEESLREFYGAGDQRCASKGTPYICVITAKVDADIKIIRGQGGELVAQLLRMHKFSFEE